MKNTSKSTAAYRTDLSISEGRRSVTFTFDDGPASFNGNIWDDAADYVVEITTYEGGCRAGALVVLKADAASQLGLERKPTIVNVVARPADETRLGMMDGHYLESSDSRWPFSSPVPIHDRFEG
jgi:hypothetical protein